MTQKASEWLRERMGELRAKVDSSEKVLQDYRDRERIVDAKGIALSGAGRQLEELTRSVVEARQKRAEAESAYALVQQIKSGRAQANYDSVPVVLRNPLVQQMKGAEAEAERRLSDAAKRYGPEHPRLIQAKAELEAARENSRRQIDIVVAGLSKEYEQARANESAVERALAQSKADIQGINRKEFQLGVLEREVQQNRNLYDMFVNRLKETSATGDLQTTIARVIDQNIAHHSGRQAVKLRATLPLDFLLIHQAQIGFVYQRRRLQAMIRALPSQIPDRQPTQLVIDQRHKLLERGSVAAAPLQKKVGNAVRRVARHAWSAAFPPDLLLSQLNNGLP